MKFNNFQPNMQILRLIAEIDVFKGLWSALSNISADRLLALKHVATIESIGSSTRIEGALLSDKEIEALLSGLKPKSLRSRDEQEVAGYAELMETIFSNWQNIPLTENHIKQLHSILLKYCHKDEKHRGNYKTALNHVEAFGPDGKSLGIIFKTASPFDTPFRMTELITWTDESLQANVIHPLLIIAVFAVVFLAIHPFKDGNGRLSRALTTLLLLKSGYTYAPYSSLESIIEHNKEGYYLALRRTQSTLDNKETDWLSWILFFLQCLQKQRENLERKIAQEHLLARDMPALSARIIELTRDRGQIKIAEIEKLTKESRSTIKLRLNELIAQGKISRHGRGPATWYTLAQRGNGVAI
jgi:Fic family protein